MSRGKLKWTIDATQKELKASCVVATAIAGAAGCNSERIESQHMIPASDARVKSSLDATQKELKASSLSLIFGS